MAKASSLVVVELDEALLTKPKTTNLDETKRSCSSIFIEEVKRICYLGGPNVVVSLSIYFLQVISELMVGHLGELYLSGTAIAIAFRVVIGFSVINNFVVVNYHMPSVEENVYSNTFAIEYKNASVILRNNDPPIVFAQLDMERKINASLAKLQIGLWIYPLLLMLINVATPNPSHVNSDVQATNLIGDDKEIVMIGVFPKFSGDEYAKFIAFAEEMKYRYYFGYTKDAKHLPLGEASAVQTLR
ncbi:hypothetical protein ACFE04_030287 [Oxalis oulophora]